MTMWDERSVETFRKMFEENATYQVIADRFGVTKGAVSRQAGRLGLKRKEPNSPERRAELKAARDQRGIQAKRDKRASRHAMGVGAQVQAINRGPRLRPEPFVCADAAAVKPKHIGIMDLTDKTCRWPYGEDPPFTYCGHAPFGSSSYCEVHFRLSVGAGSRGEQYAVRLPRKVA